MPKCRKITSTMLTRAHSKIARHEPRTIFYNAALLAVNAAIARNADLTVGEAVSLLLWTWNRRFYTKSRPFTVNHISKVTSFYLDHQDALRNYRQRDILSLSDEDAEDISTLFECLEKVVGAVGAAKVLHLLAPDFFSLWDNKIAYYGYGLALNGMQTRGNRYFSFMKCQKQQVQQIGNGFPEGVSALRAIDEHNYVRYTNPGRKRNAGGRR